MSWNRRRQEGFALGALLCDDRAAQVAQRGLNPAIGPQVAALAQELAQRGRAQRRAFVRSMLDAGAARTLICAKDAPPASARQARALSLLATELRPELGRAALSAAPRPRPGYVPPPGLLRVLRRHFEAPAGHEPAGEEPS